MAGGVCLVAAERFALAGGYSDCQLLTKAISHLLCSSFENHANAALKSDTSD